MAERGGPPPLRSIADQARWSASPTTMDQCSADSHVQQLATGYGILAPPWISAFSTLANAAGSPMMPGLNLAEAAPGPLSEAADSSNTIAFATALQKGLPANLPRAYELGNEPDAYAGEAPFAMGTPVQCTVNTIRGCGYDTDPTMGGNGSDSYIADYTSVAAQLSAVLGTARTFAGPTAQGGFQVAPYLGDILKSAGP